MSTITPVTVKGGVMRVIDNATGDTARTTSGFIEAEQYGVKALQAAAGWSAEFDSAVTRTGAFTVKLSHTNTTGSNYACTGTNIQATMSLSEQKYAIPIKGSTTYLLSCYVKTVDVVANGAFIQFCDWGANNARLDNTASTKLAGTNDWTLLTITITTNASATQMTWGFMLNVAGAVSSAWFDINSMTLEEVATINNTSAVPMLLYPSLTAVSSTSNIDQSLDPTGTYTNTYAIPTAIDEGATHRQTFTPTKTNQTGIAPWCITAGTGNWTVTVHDASNNVQGTPATILNGSLAAGLLSFLNTFTWASGNLHFHITSTVNDGTVKANTSNDLETASFESLYNKNTCNYTVRTATQTLSTTATTTTGWANAATNNTKGQGITPLTLAAGNNTVYYSSNGTSTADLTKDPSYQATIGGTTYRANSPFPMSLQ